MRDWISQKLHKSELLFCYGKYRNWCFMYSMLPFKLNLQGEPLFCFVKGQLYLAALGTLRSREILGWSLQLCTPFLSFSSRKAPCVNSYCLPSREGRKWTGPWHFIGIIDSYWLSVAFFKNHREWVFVHECSKALPRTVALLASLDEQSGTWCLPLQRVLHNPTGALGWAIHLLRELLWNTDCSISLLRPWLFLQKMKFCSYLALFPVAQLRTQNDPITGMLLR